MKYSELKYGEMFKFTEDDPALKPLIDGIYKRIRNGFIDVYDSGKFFETDIHKERRIGFKWKDLKINPINYDIVILGISIKDEIEFKPVF